MKRVAVTGGAGFIGSHLAEELASQGFHVTIVDDLSTGKMANVERLCSNGHVDFAQESIVNLPALRKLFRGADYVFHQAALASVPLSIEKPELANEVNLTGTLNVLLAARDNGARKVVFASSAAVYGDTPLLPNQEDMTPSPMTPYAVTKLAGEHYCRVFHEVYGVPTVCLRYFNVYGPRQDVNSSYSAAISKFIQLVSEGEPPVIFGDGEQARDFVFVGDIVRANIMAAESAATGVYNIGTGSSVSVNELAEKIVSAMGRQLEPVHAAPRTGDIRLSVADISRARAFDYRPRTSLEEGLLETVRSLPAYRAPRRPAEPLSA